VCDQGSSLVRLFKVLENDEEWEGEQIFADSNTDSDSSTEKSDSDDEVFTINSVDDELKGIFKELRTLSFDDKFAKSDDEIIDSNEHETILNDDETQNEEVENESQFVINLGIYTFVFNVKISSSLIL
jgi:hypothetical protein